MSFLKLAANPVEASAAYFPERKPKIRERRQAIISIIPMRSIVDISPLLMPLSIRLAIMVGISTSITTSSVTKNGAKRDAFLYCLMLLKRCFIIFL